MSSKTVQLRPQLQAHGEDQLAHTGGGGACRRQLGAERNGRLAERSPLLIRQRILMGEPPTCLSGNGLGAVAESERQNLVSGLA